MKILATSDTHGSLPEVPECDIFIIAGDVCPVVGSHHPTRQAHWMNKHFLPWLKRIPAKDIVFVAGNHDFVMEVYPNEVRAALPKNVHYLENEYADIQGLEFFGTPYIPQLEGWAFYKPDENLAKAFAKIPKGMDFLVSHGPPYGVSDQTSQSHVGSKPLLERIDIVKPDIVICGHIHEGRGAYKHYFDGEDDYCDVINVAYLNRSYQPVIENAVVDVTPFL